MLMINNEKELIKLMRDYCKGMVSVAKKEGKLTQDVKNVAEDMNRALDSIEQIRELLE